MNENTKNDQNRNDDMPLIKVSVKKGSRQSVSAVKRGRGEIVIGQKRVAAEEKKAALGINNENDNAVGEDDVVIGVRKGKGSDYIGSRSVNSVKKNTTDASKKRAVTGAKETVKKASEDNADTAQKAQKKAPEKRERTVRSEGVSLQKDNAVPPEGNESGNDISESKPAAIIVQRRNRPSAADRDMRRQGEPKKRRPIDISGTVNNAGDAMMCFPENAKKTVGSVGRGVRQYKGEAVADTADYAKTMPSRIKRMASSKKNSSGGKSSKWRVIGIVAACVASLVLVVGLVVFLVADSMLGKINFVTGDEYGEMTQSEADAYLKEQLSLTDLDDEDEPGTAQYTPGDDEDEPEPEPTSTANRKVKKLSEFKESMYDIKKDDVYNILLLGTDSRKATYVRDNSDTMILCSVNTKDHNIKLTSFMRDSYVTIPGHRKARLNAAFAIGGANLLFKTLDKNFGVKVDKFVRVNFTAFKKAVDVVGGIDMEVTSAEAKYMCSNKKYGKFPEYKKGAGVYHMNGSAALNYARIRKIDSDFGRTERQRKVIVAIISKLKGSNLSTLIDLMGEILPLVETNLTKSEIYSLIPIGLQCLSTDIETLNVPISGAWSNLKVGGAEVLDVNLAKNKKAVKAHVYSTISLSNAKTLSLKSKSADSDTTESKVTLKSTSTTASETKRTAATKRNG